jgi:DNA polymerase-3 subunit epsilon
MARQIVLDTETTGLEPSQGHRIIEIGCVEMVDRRLTRRTFHQYLQPDREIDQGAIEVHGITNEFLEDKPRFADVARDFMDFIQGAELVIHNAPFDVGFLNHELKMLGPDWGSIEAHCRILDTLALARELHPGQRNNLDALCKRYSVDNSNRELHGALLDAEILADVYLCMTGGQVALSLDADVGEDTQGNNNERHEQKIRRLPAGRPALRVIAASEHELQAHRERLTEVEKMSGGNVIWQNLPDPDV